MRYSIMSYSIIYMCAVLLYPGSYEGPLSAVEAPGDGREDRGQA